MARPNYDDEYLDRLRAYYRKYRHIPSLQRICELMGFNSKTAAVRLMERLSEGAYVERCTDDGAWITGKKFSGRVGS